MNNSVNFYSGVGTVTGSNFLFTSGTGAKILIDCGLIQGERFSEEINAQNFAYDPSVIDALLITHAHLDHVGRIPKLVKAGFKGEIYSTPQTRELAQLVLEDAVNILAEEAKRDNRQPLYGDADVAAVFPLWKTIPYHQSFKVKDVSITFKDAGHILGSSMIEISVTKNDEPDGAPSGQQKILFSGDLGNSPAPLLKDTESPGAIDYLVIESTYGDRNHQSREERTQEFERIIKETIGRGGTLVIPAFSVDRTQVLLYELNNMVEQGRIQSVPVFVDSPLATKVTSVYAANTDLFNEKVRAQIKSGDDILRFPRLSFTVNSHQSHDIDRMKGAKIILAGSGMSAGGRVIGHEEYFLPDAKNTILLVGYQTAGSLGRRLAEGAKKVNIHGKVIQVKAKIETLYGYSAHKDGDHLVEFVSQAKEGGHLKKIFVVMGEPGASMHLAQRINDELDMKALVPEIGKRYELDF